MFSLSNIASILLSDELFNLISLFPNMKFYCQNSMQINDIQFKHHYFIDFAENKYLQGVIIFSEGGHLSLNFS